MTSVLLSLSLSTVCLWSSTTYRQRDSLEEQLPRSLRPSITTRRTRTSTRHMWNNHVCVGYSSLRLHAVGWNSIRLLIGPPGNEHQLPLMNRKLFGMLNWSSSSVTPTCLGFRKVTFVSLCFSLALNLLAISVVHASGVCWYLCSVADPTRHDGLTSFKHTV